MTSWKNALRDVEITEEEMKNNRHICTCNENPNVNEFGDNSWLPCMSWESDCNLECKQCIYCKIIK